MARLAPTGISFRETDDDGNPLAGGLLYTYEAGTTNPKATYTSSSGVTANTNPVVLDSAGRARVWLGEGAYKFVLKDSDEAEIWTEDNVAGTTESAFGSQVVELDSNLTVTAPYANSVLICTTSLTLTLPPADEAGSGFYFSLKNAGTGTVTVEPDGSEEIDGEANATFEADTSGLVLCDGEGWTVIFADTVTPKANNAFSGNNTFGGDSTITGKLFFPDEGELTISSGDIAVTGTYHTIDTEGDAATDDLVNIDGGADGQQLFIRTADDARDITLKASGNIGILSDITLSRTNDVLGLIFDGEMNKWLVKSATAAQGAKADTALQPSVLHLQHQAASGTNGGTATAGAWETRVLNTEVTDTIGSTLSSNEFTLPAGTYEITAFMPALLVNRHQGRLYNVTDAAMAVLGTVGYSGASGSTGDYNPSLVRGRFTITATKTFRMEHRVAVTRATDGYGLASGWGTEIYADVFIRKVA